MKVNAVVGCWLRRVFAIGMLAGCVPVAAVAADQWIKPTPEELALKSVPGFPGAPAMYLFREEITKDDLHVFQHYERIKILTEEGKKYANIELNFVSSQGDGDSVGDDKSIGDISGRTIHADGTVIPFTGKPYLKTMEKGKDFKYQARVFTLPDVEVGSIIEYRYSTRYNDDVYESPDWFVQSELYTRAAHFVWYPTTGLMSAPESEGGGMITHISWFPILPDGVAPQRRDLPSGGRNGAPSQVFELNIKDVPPSPKEEFMPPIASFTYRVMFSFTPYATPAEYWKARGKAWSKQANNFIGPDSALTAATQPVIAGASTQDEKLHKIYAAVMNLDNTDYTRSHDQKEDKAAGLKKVSSAVDVLKHGRGNSAQLVYLFVGMARAAGMKAYAMLVPNRSQRLFVPAWTSMSQFANTIAIVNVDGKEVFFGPGERYVPYGHLEWEYSFVQGLRQTDGGTDFAITPGDSYKDTKTARVANLTMGEDGTVRGTISMSFDGANALRWRQRALTGDEESLRKGLRESLEETLPKTLEIKVESIENLKEYEKPLIVKFDTTGTLGTATGKRLMLPVDLFQAEEKIPFTEDKRDIPVYFHYPELINDALRINLPASMSIEAVPVASKVSVTNMAMYTLTSTAAPTNVTVRRSFAFGTIIVPPKDYGSLRSFYSQFQAKDQESIVLKMAPATTASVTPPRN